MKAHVEPKSKECPFCGASTYEVMSGTGVKCIRSVSYTHLTLPTILRV